MKKTIHNYYRHNSLLRFLFVFIFSAIAGNADAQTTVTIGSTTTTTSTYMIPINNLYGYSYTQQVLLATEIGIPGRISKIRFRYNTGSMALNDDWTVYLGYKTTGTFASTTDWVPLSSLVQVYSGTVTAANNWIEITLATPFVYSPGNGNLVVAVDENSPSYTYTSTMFPTNAGTNRSIYYRSDGTNPSPASPPTGTLNSFFNTIQLDMLGLAACTGVPSGGTTVATPAVVCLGNTSSIGISGGSTDTGTVFQWQDSVASGTWQNIPGATGFLYTTAPLTSQRYFRRRITCLASNGVGYSSPVPVAIDTNGLPYLETFESITVANTLPKCMTATNLNTQTQTFIANQTTYNRTNHTPGGSKFASFRYATGTDVLATPGFTLQAGKTYLFNYWYITDGLTGWTSLQAFWGTSPTVAGLTNLIGAAPAPQTNTTYQEFTGTFTPTVTGVYYVGIVCTRTSSPWYLTIDDIGLRELVPCSGAPVAGTIDSISPCPNQVFTLTTSGGTSPTSFGGLTFEWQDSTVSNGWVSSTGVNTNPTYTTSISVPTKFRRITTCANGGQVAITPTYTVIPAAFINCYCVPTYATGATANVITNVKLNGLNNTSTGAAPWYTNYAPQQPSPIMIPTITMGATTDTVIITHSTNATNYSGVWIDFNHSGTFDPSEFFSLGSNAGASGVARIPINTPVTALPGRTRMRIRGADRSVVTSTMPCGATASAYGEAEDYLVNIQYPVCSGPANAGRAEVSDSAICIGYTINVYDTTHEYRRSQISWSWESSRDGGSSWNTVAGSLNKDTLLNIPVTGPVQYRLKMICDATGDSSYSTVANVRIKAPYACYCVSQSNGGAADISDIGAVVIGSMINSTGGPHLENPSSIRRRTDYTDIRNIVLSANGRYKLSIFHTQRNDMHADALVTVFIDYNTDGEYNAATTPNSERVFQGISTAPNYYIDTAIRIPNVVIPNVPTGLRVILNNDLNPNSPANLGCGTYTSGETEDYVVMFTRTPQSVSSIVGLDHVSVYPNPTSGRFVLNAGAQNRMGNLDVTVTTLTGSTVLRKSYKDVGTKFSSELDLGEVARGVYFVEVRTAEGDKMVQKLMVK